VGKWNILATRHQLGVRTRRKGETGGVRTRIVENKNGKLLIAIVSGKTKRSQGQKKGKSRLRGRRHGK